MGRLKDLLMILHQGNRVVLEARENQEGSLVDVDYIYFENGSWFRSKLNCWSAQDYGFGTCRCVSHPAFGTDRISRKEVLSQLHILVRKENEDAEERQAELAWLERAIAELPVDQG